VKKRTNSSCVELLHFFDHILIIFRLDALALSVIATATWLAGWLAVCTSLALHYCSTLSYCSTSPEINPSSLYSNIVVSTDIHTTSPTVAILRCDTVAHNYIDCALFLTLALKAC